MSCIYVNKLNKDSFDILLDIKLMDIYPKDFEYDIKYSSLLGLSNKYIDGKWSIKKFCNFFKDKIVLSALSTEEVELISDSPATSLENAFENLRKVKNKDNTEGKITDGEVGEIFLYGIMREYYQATVLVPKIFYKQNTNDTVKGGDSVTITLSNNEVGIWFGESKFYSNINNAINDSVKSISDFLKDKINKEISISYDCLRLDNIKKMLMEKSNEELYNKLKYLLRKDNIDKLKQHMHIPILILYECDITKSSKSQEELIKRDINNIFKEKSFMLLKKQITKLKENNIYNYESIKFHIILFPCVDKDKIMDNINNIAKNYMQYE